MFGRIQKSTFLVNVELKEGKEWNLDENGTRLSRLITVGNKGPENGNEKAPVHYLKKERWPHKRRGLQVPQGKLLTNHIIGGRNTWQKKKNRT